jgi:transposase-like protein
MSNVIVVSPTCKAWVNRRVVFQAVVVARGCPGGGRREVLGFGVGDIEDLSEGSMARSLPRPY